MSEDKLQDERRRGFYMIDNDIIDKYGAEIGVYGIAVYSFIARYASGKNDSAFPSYQTIADKLGISRPKAVTTINKLVDLGLIKKEKRTDDAGDSTSNLYTLVDMGGGKPHLPPSKQGLPPSTSDLPGVVNDVNQGSKQGLPYKDKEINTKDKKKTTIVAGGVSTSEKPEGWDEVVSAYESNIGMFTAMTSDMVAEAINDYGAVQVVDAIKEAVKNNVRKWSYVEGILKRWKANGKVAKTITPKANDEWLLVNNQYDNTKYWQNTLTGDKKPYVNA